ncbi:arginine-tRNA-protein transferase [Myxozyma melibiosi]|uniref:Arginyl-tRNA--protein transferase 1 n=1 Tax=Myxozyma melibiosi TaxID=54550 RepID=A0ABR1F3Z7_9ASCO
MRLSDTPVTVITPGTYQSGRKCGYCGRDDGSAIFGFSALSLTAADYQEFMDRGYRRSGTFMYKPDLLHSCCPQYAIRLRVSDYKPSKEHRQTINRFNRFVLGAEYEDALQRYEKAQKPKDKTRKKNAEFDLLHAIHRAESALLPPSLSHIPRAHDLSVRLVTPEYTDEKFALYKHYQISCHHDAENEITSSGFVRFLCGKPFELASSAEEEGKKRLGLWHQMYYLDGKLIAMAVLDFLPNSISGVYFMWAEEYGKYSLGKLSACREAALAAEEGDEFYYMGLYIYSCQKMKYKAAFAPSELLDPELYEYFRFDRFEPELEKCEYVTFSSDADAVERARRRRVESEMAVDDEERDKTDEQDAHSSDDDDDDDDDMKTLFEADMPGIPPLTQIKTEIDLSKVQILVNHYVITAKVRPLPYFSLTC